MYRKHPIVALLVALTIAALVSLAGARAANSALDTSIVPPDGIYTCSWIAGHPTAATLAGVSCREDMVNPGSSVSPESVGLPSGLGTDSPDANGCQQVPGGGGKISVGVYAATTYEYSDAWSWIGGFGPYEWYIQKTTGVYEVYGGVFDNGPYDIGGLQPNIYRWKVHNEGYGPASWWPVCYSD